MERKVLKVEKFKGYEVREELIEEPGVYIFEKKSAYNPNGDYIGAPEDAKYLCTTLGIAPEKLNPSDCVCSIGFCAREKRWYGWSQRAFAGFGIGSEVKKGDCGFSAKGAWTAKNLDDAKQMAINFAKSVD